MEIADSSMIGNDSVGHHLINNRKMISDSGSDVNFDSGYASGASISYNQTVASAPSHSPLICHVSHHTTSMRKSLEPIAENLELTFNEGSAASNIETPTTRSIRRLNDFHIQTPENDRRMQETTPTKANYFSNLQRSVQKSSTKKNRIISSPYERNGSVSSPQSTFTERINSAEHHKRLTLYDSTENNENSFEMTPNESSIGISPIGYHNKSSIAAEPIMHEANSRRTLQRHPSGIESSTPILRPLKRTHTQTVVKTHYVSDGGANDRLLLRKTQSFSPAKRSANILKEISINARATLERHDEQFEEDETVVHRESNPARKMLAFSTNQFESLLKSGQDVAPMPTVSNIKAPKTPTKLTKRTSTLKRQQCVSFTPSPPPIASPARNHEAKQTIQEKAMRRPMKKLERSFSYNPTPPDEKRIEKVQNTSIYCTPPKLNRRKRSAAIAIGIESNASDASVSVEPPAKRKLYYAGLEKLDILTRLRGAHNVTDLILSMLSDEDLNAAYRVSRSWSHIIENNWWAYARQSRYTRALLGQKENTNNDANARAHRTESAITDVKIVKRKPFGQKNVHYSLRPLPCRSPPVSPSKITFHENQKVVKKLKPDQRMTRCPRCNGGSIIHAASEPLPASPSPAKFKPNLLFARRKGYSCPMPSTNNLSFGATARAWKSFDEHRISKAVISEYAVCHRLACGYSFCTNCNCDRHVDSVCPVRPISSSPTSDEDTMPRPRDIRNSRRNLRRLLN